MASWSGLDELLHMQPENHASTHPPRSFSIVSSLTGNLKGQVYYFGPA